MYKIIGGDQREYGPISIDQLREWFKEGRVNAETQVQAEGETGWKPLGSLPEFAGPAGGAAAPASSPPPISTVGGPLTAEAVLARGTVLDVGSCIGRSWNLVKENMGIAIGATALVVIAVVVGQSIAQLIPVLGSIVSLVLNGILYGGLYWFFLKLIRGEAPTIADAFAGFSRSTVQLLLAGTVMGLITMVAVVLVMLPFMFTAVLGALGGGGGKFSPAMGAGVVVGVVLMLVVVAIVSVIWIFTLPLVIDKQIGFWEAMELSRKVAMRNFGKVLALVLAGMLIAVAGVLACCVGVFYAVPVVVGAFTYAYEDFFGAPAA